MSDSAGNIPVFGWIIIGTFGGIATIAACIAVIKYRRYCGYFFAGVPLNISTQSTRDSKGMRPPSRFEPPDPTSNPEPPSRSEPADLTSNPEPQSPSNSFFPLFPRQEPQKPLQESEFRSTRPPTLDHSGSNRVESEDFAYQDPFGTPVRFT